MISIQKTPNAPPTFSGPNYESKFRLALEEKNNHKFSTSIYRNGSILQLRDTYSSKCGYCESNSEVAASLRVDHYRPKNKIKNVAIHIGYYWLGYEWKNLILCCEKCNRRKSNHFPLSDESHRILHPVFEQNGLPLADYMDIGSALMQQESPLILNPEIHEVEQHFYFLPDGRIMHLTDAGATTIQMCGLNREDLILARKTIVDDFRAEFSRCLADYSNNLISEETLIYTLKLIFSRLLLRPAKTTVYSRLGWFMVNKFDIFFSNAFAETEAVVLSTAFNRYLNGTL